ncbi:MAG: hypothetical protein ACRCVV_22130 [Shewanella sp.]
MLLFQIDQKDLVITPLLDYTAKINKHSVFIKGKRRDRVTDRYVWTSDINEAINILSVAIEKQQKTLRSQIASFNLILEQLDQQLAAQTLLARKALQEANDDFFN